VEKDTTEDSKPMDPALIFDVVGLTKKAPFLTRRRIYELSCTRGSKSGFPILRRLGRRLFFYWPHVSRWLNEQPAEAKRKRGAR